MPWRRGRRRTRSRPHQRPRRARRPPRACGGLIRSRGSPPCGTTNGTPSTSSEWAATRPLRPSTRGSTVWTSRAARATTPLRSRPRCRRPPRGVLGRGRRRPARAPSSPLRCSYVIGPSSSRSHGDVRATTHAQPTTGRNYPGACERVGGEGSGSSGPSGSERTYLPVARSTMRTREPSFFDKVPNVVGSGPKTCRYARLFESV